jgi:chromosomal replication initiation ATPase DnaA
MAIYLLKRHTGATNAEIGKMFGGISYSAVAKIKERFAREMEENRKLRKMAGKIDTELSNVKG